MKRIILSTTKKWAKENETLENQPIVQQIIRTIKYWKIKDDKEQ